MSPLLCCYDRALRREKPLSNDITALRRKPGLEEVLHSPLLSSEDRAVGRYSPWRSNVKGSSYPSVHEWCKDSVREARVEKR